MNKLKIAFRNLVQGIKNLIRWFRIIWNDREWDNWFLEEIIIQKLHNMADHFDDPLLAFTESAPQKAKHMRLAAKLLQKYQDGYYSSEYLDYYAMDFYIDEHGYLQTAEESRYDNLNVYFKKYKGVHRQILSGKIKVSFLTDLNDRQMVAMQIGYYNEQRARRLAYKIMDTYSPGWWD